MEILPLDPAYGVDHVRLCGGCAVCDWVCGVHDGGEWWLVLFMSGLSYEGSVRGGEEVREVGGWMLKIDGVEEIDVIQADC